MIAFLSRNLIATLAIGAILLGVVWYFFLSSNPPVEEELLEVTEVSQESEAEREIVETLLTLQAITLSATIFSDPVFAVLKDFGTEIAPEPTGRVNPFAPRESGSTPPTSSGEADGE